MAPNDAVGGSPSWPTLPARDTAHASWPRRTSSSGWTSPVPFAESVFGEAEAEAEAARHRVSASRWLGWRLRLLVVCALAGCIGFYVLVWALQSMPSLDAVWDLDAQGRVVLVSTDDATLEPHVGQALQGVIGDQLMLRPDDALVQRPARRWIVDDAERRAQIDAEQRLRHALLAADARLVFENGSQAPVHLGVRGPGSLQLVFWLLIGFAFALYLAGVVVLLAYPCVRNGVYAVMAACQSANLVLVAIDGSMPLGPSPELARWSLPLQFALDWLTAAAMVHAACLHPRRLPGARSIGGATWAAVAVLAALAGADVLRGVWWWGQGTVTLLGLLAVGLFSWSYRLEAHPSSIALRRFGIVMLSSWVLLTLSVDRFDQPEVAAGPVVWYLLLASLLLLVPFLARSQDFMREFALLAGISTVATSLDLLFVTVFALGTFTSLALALFAALAVYTGLRQWMLNRLLGTSIRTTERLFEQLYRAAREVEAHAERAPALLSQLLSDLFEPLEVSAVERRSVRSRVLGAGSTLTVPVPELGGGSEPPSSILVRYARRGRRLFTDEDARFADRIVEQLRSAVYFDKAVEQGRNEERLRLAQDLHDDIGARLLTLMYTATSPETEDYVRHTLQDLKTLTRGLAEANHRLSHAAAEWKSDIAQRLTAAGIELKWDVAFDADVALTVVQWSALTRIMRELISNAIAHSRAHRLEIDFRLRQDEMLLRVVDDGVGREPAGWSQGLGLGGIRKRVKQLGGRVEWREHAPHGIECRVRIGPLTAR